VDASIAHSVQGDTLIMDFPDNRLLSELFGQYDRHLARIEQQIGCRVTSRGNKVAISGTEAARETTRRVLDDLYNRLRQGLEVGPGEVDGAIRMASSDEPADPHTSDETLHLRTRKRIVTPRSARQAAYIRALTDNELVFALGPAGTGKTYIAVAHAVQQLLQGRVDRLVLSRPAVEAGERLGFLPGDLREKVDPYLRPLYDALHDMLPGDQVMKRLESGEIEVAPLAFMRGRTLANSYVILDEAQNCTPMQMKMFLTRLGENSCMAVTGDPSQVDLPPGVRSGLTDGVETLTGIEGVAIVRFTDADVVRHPLVARIVRAYNERDARTDRAVPPANEGEA
jgi:phosphate starvation-inducible PhoH-like protein